MKVTETTSFDEYWSSPRFRLKRPQFRGSEKQAYGDNIYHSEGEDQWIQARSHHSFPDGSPNPLNLEPDTRHPRVLISDDFAYWGSSAPEIPASLRNFRGSQDICHDRQGYRAEFPADLIVAFEEWFRSLGENGCVGWPERWK